MSESSNAWFAGVVCLVSIGFAAFTFVKWQQARSNRLLGISFLGLAVAVNSAITSWASSSAAHSPSANTTHLALFMLNVGLLAVAAFFMWKRDQKPTAI